MNNGTLTYAQLAAKLKSLGYTEDLTEVRGKPARVFEHQTRKKAIIFLPDGADEKVVESPFLNKVNLILRTHGLTEEGALIN